MAEVAVPLAEIERAIIAVLLSEPRAIIPVWGVLKARDFANGVYARIYDACLTLAHAATIPNPYTVAAQLSDVALDVLLSIQKYANPQLVADVLALADIVRREAQLRRTIAITQDVAAGAVARPRDLEGFVYHSMQQLALTIEGETDRPSDLATIVAEVEREMQSNEVVGISTGFGWLTDRIGGFRPGNIVGIVAPYKGRKSTTMRHMLLAAAREKRQVALYSLEGSRNDVVADLWAMLATEQLLKICPTPAEFAGEATLDGTHLRNELLTERQYQAKQQAREELAKLMPYVHISDGRDGIASLAVFRARITRDRFLFGTEELILDHLQLMSTGSDSTYEKVEGTVETVQKFTANEGVVSIILSQKNEASINAGDDGYSPGSKGGGALPAAADILLTTAYDAEKNPDLFTLRLKLARRAQPGKRVYEINPSSGLMLQEANL